MIGLVRSTVQTIPIIITHSRVSETSSCAGSLGSPEPVVQAKSIQPGSGRGKGGDDSYEYVSTCRLNNAKFQDKTLLRFRIVYLASSPVLALCDFNPLSLFSLFSVQK